MLKTYLDVSQEFRLRKLRLQILHNRDCIVHNVNFASQIKFEKLQFVLDIEWIEANLFFDAN